MEIKENLKELVSNLPQQPGIYRYYDEENQLLYVGKAKNLKNRVSSYFTNSKQHSYKTRKMVAQIHQIRYTAVNSEQEALLLENTLIKTYQPKYNILLKDDKTFPYLCVSDEPFPRVFVTRQPEKKEGKYYGPYSKPQAMNTVKDLLHELYTLRTCHLSLTQANIKAQKFKVCLEFHIGNCQGPCEAKQSLADYEQDMEQVHHILKGNLGMVKSYFKEKMMTCAENLEFEKAQEFKQKLERLENFQSKSLVVNPNIQELDVFSIVSEEKNAFVNYLKIKDGAIIHSQNVHIKKKLDETDEDILSFVIFDLRQVHHSKATEVITNLAMEPEEISSLNYSLPKIGDKKKLVDLSLKNALLYKRDKMKAYVKSSPDEPIQSVKELQQVLQMDKPPVHIECFDNSNIQGTDPVASMVYFQNGKPLKREYRHFNIKTVEGPNDFASMQEIVARRYKRILEEKKELPDLIIIDGGKGQLSSACLALKEVGVYGQIPIIGIAKRLEEIYLPEDDIPLHISKRSSALKLIQKARDEAHRFAIEFHRLKRSKRSLVGELEKIEGVGKATVQKLLRHFKSVKKIKEASQEELEEVVGKAKTQVLLKAFEVN
jgi:excinuclease ABC subunit C